MISTPPLRICIRMKTVRDDAPKVQFGDAPADIARNKPKTIQMTNESTGETLNLKLWAFIFRTLFYTEV